MSNALYKTCLKYSATLRKDLERLDEILKDNGAGDSGGATTDADTGHTSDSRAGITDLSQLTSIQGQVTASLTSLERRINDYAQLSARDQDPKNQERAKSRQEDLRRQYEELRASFRQMKARIDDARHSQSRTSLLNGGNESRNRQLGRRTAAGRSDSAEVPPAMMGATTSSASAAGGPGSTWASMSRTDGALRESSFLDFADVQLDELLERGRTALGDLVDQRNMLKSTQKTLFKAASKLGVSRDTIKYIERRARQDKWIFYGGALVTFIVFYLIVRHFG